MRTLISNNNGYKTYVEKNDYLRSNGNKQIRFLTVWEDAKDPTGEQVKFEMFLTPEQQKKLKDFF